MNIVVRMITLLAVSIGTLAAPLTNAQTYPARPVRIVIPGGSGAPPDIIARALSQPLTQTFGQPFVVENRVGANGIIGMEAVVKSAPDGYTLCITQGAPVSLNPYFYSKLPYEPLRDLAPIVNVGVIAASIVVSASVPANSMRELIEAIRSKPESLLWATWGAGSFSDLYRAWAHNPAAIEEEAIQEYLRCFRQAGAMRAAFDDYRAGASIDLEHDATDRHRKIAVPTLVLWGQSRPTQAADMLAVWQPRCERVEGFAVPDCGHFIPEEQPGAVVKAVLKFVASGAGPS